MAEKENLNEEAETPEVKPEDTEIPETPEEPIEPVEPEEIKIENSILSSVKKLIGIQEEDESFDLDIMLNINAASSTLFQLGVLDKPYTVTSKNDTYADLIPSGTEDVVNQIKMYFVYKVRIGFDSSTLSSTVIETIKELIREAEWRLMTSFNPPDTYAVESEETGGEIQNE